LPADRLKALRDAFDATMKDAAFRADADKAQLEIESLNGQQVADLVAELYEVPAATVARVRKALSGETRTVR
jgi:predicted transcriptional regulator